MSWMVGKTLKRLCGQHFSTGHWHCPVTNFPLNNAGVFQGIYNDGNATLIQLSPPHRVTFAEEGLRPGTSWSVILNGHPYPTVPTQLASMSSTALIGTILAQSPATMYPPSPGVCQFREMIFDGQLFSHQPDML